MILTDPAKAPRWHWPLTLCDIWAFAFSVRYYYVTHAQVFQPVNQANVRGDAVEYYNYARNLYEYGIFSKMPPSGIPPHGDSFRDPGYPVFLAAWMKIFSQWESWYAAVLLSQALLSSLTVILMLATAHNWMPMRWLVAAGLLMSVWPHNIAMSSYLLSETLFGFLAALGLFLFKIAMDRRKVMWAGLSGVAFSLAALTNAVLIPLAPVLAAYLLFRKKAGRKLSVALAIGALAVIAPWTLRNSLVPVGASESSSSGRALINLIQGSWPSMHRAYQASMKGNPNGIVIMTAIERENASFQSSPSAGLALIGHRFATHPGEYLWWYLSKPALLWDWDIRIGQGDIYVYPTRNSPFKTDLIFRAIAALCRAINPWLFALAVVGAVLGLLPRQKGTRGSRRCRIDTGLYYLGLQRAPGGTALFDTISRTGDGTRRVCCIQSQSKHCAMPRLNRPGFPGGSNSEDGAMETPLDSTVHSQKSDVGSPTFKRKVRKPDFAQIEIFKDQFMRRSLPARRPSQRKGGDGRHDLAGC